MGDPKQEYIRRRGEILVRNLRKRNFGACYCETRQQALKKALELIGKDQTIGWGGALSAQQIGLMDALNQGGYHTLDRSRCKTPEEQEQCMRECLLADVFLTGANAISLTGEMVNIDGNGNRVAAIVYGPRKVLVIAGMNKVVDTLQDAIRRARTIAAPMNKLRFPDKVTPCQLTGACEDCISRDCICNQVLVTRRSRLPERIYFIMVEESLGF